MATRHAHQRSGSPPDEPPAAPEPDAVDRLVAEYGQTQSPAIRERIVVACTPMVRRIAMEFVYAGVSIEDLAQVGFVGLLNAIAAFDHSRGVKFATYATYLIRGEIRHYLRDQRDAIRKPRWLQRLNAQIEEAIGSHLSETGRFPTLEALSEHLNIEEDGILEVLRTREVLRTISLEGDDDVDLRVHRDRIRHRTHVSFQLPIEDRVVLTEALESLNAMQRKVIYYLFFTDLTQMEAAKRIGVSQKHVSRVLAQALGRLRSMLGAASPGMM